ncbi:MAG: hypothetical protein NZO58_05720 [Gemmataceae bacterium]|nr:hypothetical protein [Gemmataceae bacterium]
MTQTAFVNLYEELAHRYELRDEIRQRDVCLLLAADAALVAGRLADAERLRRRLLQLNPHHLLRPYGSLVEAMKSRDIQDYIADLRRQLPPEHAERLLHGSNGQAPPRASDATPQPSLPAPTVQQTASPAAHYPEPTPLPVPLPRRELTASPYERFDIPLPSGPGYDAIGSWVAAGLYFLVFAAVIALAAYVVLRPIILR